MLDEEKATQTIRKRAPWNKEQADRRKASTATQTCLVNPDETPN
jgi:hypothetical protein